MRRIFCFLLLIIPITSCLSQSGFVVHNITQRLDSIVKNYVDSSEFIGSVLIAKNGEILLKKGYGFADIENKIPNTPSTNFYLASVSKLFTIAAIIELKDKGLLNLDDSLTKFIPDYPYGNHITIRQLIEHKSGIVDYVNERPYAPILNAIKLDDIIDKFKRLPLNFKSGEKTSYCNSGYILLAKIIEIVSGMDYSNYIENNIFKVLGMNSSFSNWNWNNFPKTQSEGYYRENGRFIKCNYYHPSQYLGAGNLTSTVEDMYKWYEAIYKKGNISLEYQSYFRGGAEWASTVFYPVISSDYIIILLSNYGNAPVDDIAKEIRDKLNQDGDTYQQLSSSSFKKYVGHFTAGDKFYFKIEKGNNCLIYYANDNNNIVSSDTVYKVAEDEFKNPNMRIAFSEMDKQSFNRILVFWGTEGYIYKRKE